MSEASLELKSCCYECWEIQPRCAKKSVVTRIGHKSVHSVIAAGRPPSGGSDHEGHEEHEAFFGGTARAATSSSPEVSLT